MLIIDAAVAAASSKPVHSIAGSPSSMHGQIQIRNTLIRSHSGTLALKTEDFSKKIGRFSKTQKWIY